MAAGIVGMVVAAAASLAPGASARPAQSASAAAASHQCLVMTGSGDAAFTHSFNPFTGSTLNGNIMKGAIYEPLLVATVAGGGHVYPWLASSWKWSKDKQDADAPDRQEREVVGRQAADRRRRGLQPHRGQAGQGDGHHRPDATRHEHPVRQAQRPDGVAITLKTPDSQFIAAQLNLQFIVPQHIWSKVKNVATFTNPNPVGSGPFDQIGRLTNQDIVFKKNPSYWVTGAPKVPCLEYQETASNDAALLAIQSGKVDWTHNFVPNVESAYEAKDPAHYHAFYSTTAYPVSLTFDDTQYPFSLVPLRQAISMSINRSDVSKLGEYGYAPPTDAIGLNGIFPQWVTDPTVKAQAQALAAYNPDGAKKLLLANGFTYNGSSLIDPKGNPVAFDIQVISGWSDWVASLQIITKNLQAVGINANVKLDPDYNTWASAAFSTKTPTLLWQNASQGSPYGFFFANLSNNAMIPSGQDGTSTGNWEHFSDASATGLLNQWKTAFNPTVQHTLATKLEAAWLRTMPVIPLFIGPRWSTYSTKYFHGFASPEGRVRRPDLHDVPRQRRVVHADRPRREGRCLTPPGRACPAGGDASPSARRSYSYSGRFPMRWLIRRICFYAFALWVAITLNFLLPRLMPGDPANGVLQRLSSSQLASNPGLVQTYRDLLGGPKQALLPAYWDYLGRVATFNFGISTTNYPTKVSAVIGQTLPYSIFLVGVALRARVRARHRASAWSRPGAAAARSTTSSCRRCSRSARSPRSSPRSSPSTCSA